MFNKEKKNMLYLKFFNEAKKSELKLLNFYKKFYEYNISKHDELYNQHISNLNALDKSIPNMKSIKKTFMSQCPNEIKPKKYNKKKLLKFLKNDRLFLTNYNQNKITTKLEFLKHHIKIQIFSIIHEYFTNMMSNIRNYQIFFVNEPSSKSNKTLKNIRFSKSTIKSKTREPVELDYRDAKTIKVKLTKKVIIEVVFTFNNGKIVERVLEHDGFYIDKKDIFNMVKDVIAQSNVKSKKQTLEDLFKEQENKIDKIILEEKKEEILIKLIKNIDTTSPNQLLNTIKKEINSIKPSRSNRSRKSNRSTSVRLKFKNSKKKNKFQ